MWYVVWHCPSSRTNLSFGSFAWVLQFVQGYIFPSEKATRGDVMGVSLLLLWLDVGLKHQSKCGCVCALQPLHCEIYNNQPTIKPLTVLWSCYSAIFCSGTLDPGFHVDTTRPPLPTQWSKQWTDTKPQVTKLWSWSESVFIHIVADRYIFFLF